MVRTGLHADWHWRGLRSGGLGMIAVLPQLRNTVVVTVFWLRWGILIILQQIFQISFQSKLSIYRHLLFTVASIASQKTNLETSTKSFKGEEAVICCGHLPQALDDTLGN